MIKTHNANKPSNTYIKKRTDSIELKPMLQGAEFIKTISTKVIF